eukprot:11718066-Heterocapsa_arctica.AAC.1
MEWRVEWGGGALAVAVPERCRVAKDSGRRELVDGTAAGLEEPPERAPDVCPRESLLLVPA